MIRLIPNRVKFVQVETQKLILLYRSADSDSHKISDSGYQNAGYRYTMHESRQFGTNHESSIVYTQVIRVPFVHNLICDSWFVNSQPLAVFARTIKRQHELDLH